LTISSDMIGIIHSQLAKLNQLILPSDLAWEACQYVHVPAKIDPGCLYDLFVISTMGGRFFVDPVLLHPTHTVSTWDLSSRPSPVVLATLGSVAERLSTPLHDMRLPVIAGDLDGHFASPDTRNALPLEGLRIEPSMPSGPVDLQTWRDAKIGRSSAVLAC